KEISFDAIRQAGGSASAISELCALEYTSESELERHQQSVDLTNAHAPQHPEVAKWAQWKCTLPDSVKRSLEEILIRSAL
ncbi:alpha-glucosidase (family 31 of glycosyl hydrolase), partial [Gardnerella vaginalis]